MVHTVIIVFVFFMQETQTYEAGTDRLLILRLTKAATCTHDIIINALAVIRLCYA